MKKRLFALFLSVCLVLGMVPAAQAAPHREPVAPVSPDRCCEILRTDISPNANRPDFPGKLIEVTPQRVEDTFAYLNEVYTEKYPEAALLYNVADEDDRQIIADLAKEITKNCKTDLQKAEAIDLWLSQSNGNILYVEDSSAYANDTYYDRIGNCLSYANLMQAMLRSLGVPAVVGDGWRGNMKTDTVDRFNYAGHAWCFAYVGGEWVLYDPLWIVGGTTDRTYIAENIYLDQVEFITPASDEDNLPPESYDRFKVYYTDGVWYMHSQEKPDGVGVFTSFVNNQMYQFVSCQDEGEISDGWDYVDGQSDDGMRTGEVYRNGWVSYGGFHPVYAHVNGMMIDGAVMEYEGRDMYMRGSEAWPVSADPEDYSIEYGTITFRTGYCGKFLEFAWGNAYDNLWGDTHTTSWESQNPDIATVDQNGNLTCHKEGVAILVAQCIRDSDGVYMSSKAVTIAVTDEERTPVTNHHDYEQTEIPATCSQDGQRTFTCTICGHSYCEVLPALGHDHRAVVTEPTCTQDGFTTHTCTRCGDVYRDNPTAALGHDWNDLLCRRCGEGKEIFSDVTGDQWFAAFIQWAIENGVTNGMGNNTFQPDTTCSRDQIVTFLWRAAGKEEPTLTKHPFTDVKAGTWYEKPVLWALEKGITTGASATLFGTEDPCERAAVVTFLWRAMGKPEPATTSHPFTDADANAWYGKAMLWAVENGITSGITATTFAPTAVCTRAQIVTFLYRAYNK